MNVFIARMIDCGLSRETALAVCRYYMRYKTITDLAEYVTALEAETYGRMEAV